MINRYKFSSESFPKLLKFIGKCKKHDLTGKTEKLELWEKVLPKNQDLINQLEKYSENQVIRISSESINIVEESQKDTTPGTDIISQNDAESSREKKCIEDIAIAITEQLKNDGRIKDEILNLSASEVEELFSHLANKRMGSENMCLLGQSLITNRKLESDAVLKYFCRYLLIAELKENEEENVRKIFLSILNHCPTILCNELAKCCINMGKEEFPRALYENLRFLQAEHKEQFLREFVLNCSKLEKGHFPVLETLVVNQVDLGILKKMIDMFSASSNEYGSNKLFGKLLFHVMQKVGNQIYRFEPDMQNIMSNHKTPWRSKMLKLFQSNMALNNTQSMSQII